MTFRAIFQSILMALMPLSAGAQPVAIGSAQTMFDWNTDRCDRWDGPDSPARAWRDRDGVTLVNGAEQTRFSRGSDLHNLRRSCRIRHQGARVDFPDAFDDRAWLASPYREPSGRLIALAHVEYHGHARPGRCDAGSYAACWWNSIVEVSGPDFVPQPNGASLVAALPMPYDTRQTRRRGYFNPSNIIQRDGFLYAFVFAEDAPPQQRGACLIRRPVGGGPGDWRAWDGRDFGTVFADPYRDAPADPTPHVCTPVPGLRSTISSVVRRAGSDDYVAVTPATLRDHDGVTRSGIWWMTSTDLIRWSRPRLLLEVPLMWRRDCATDAAYAYPSLLDPDSPSDNFETVGADFWLTLVRIHLDSACKTGPHRDLVRFRVNWPGPREPQSAPPDRRPAPGDRADDPP